MIPGAAVEAAVDVFLDEMDTIPTALVRAALQAAAPYMLAEAEESCCCGNCGL